ncbi:hypothetical protein TA3x_001097 [Tundrisphaera sp. TA3]|uniref:hypothetical protein n=1 Tax=Tundrisphaera sp. TA3 TaxID=3435775 RepID=UPI003EBA78AA
MTMPDRKGPQPPDESLLNGTKSVIYSLVVMNILADGHRVVHYQLGSPGTRAFGKFTGISVGIAYPVFVAFLPPESASQNQSAYLLWLALIAMAFLHSSAAFWSPSIRHSQEIGKPIFGRMELPVAFLAIMLATAACGPGAGLYLFAALLANLIQIETIRARFKRQVAMQRDAQIEAAEFQSFMK